MREEVSDWGAGMGASMAMRMTLKQRYRISVSCTERHQGTSEENDQQDSCYQVNGAKALAYRGLCSGLFPGEPERQYAAGVVLISW